MEQPNSSRLYERDHEPSSQSRESFSFGSDKEKDKSKRSKKVNKVASKLTEIFRSMAEHISEPKRGSKKDRPPSQSSAESRKSDVKVTRLEEPHAPTAETEHIEAPNRHAEYVTQRTETSVSKPKPRSFIRRQLNRLALWGRDRIRIPSVDGVESATTIVEASDQEVESEARVQYPKASRNDNVATHATYETSDYSGESNRHSKITSTRERRLINPSRFEPSGGTATAWTLFLHERRQRKQLEHKVRRQQKQLEKAQPKTAGIRHHSPVSEASTRTRTMKTVEQTSRPAPSLRRETTPTTVETPDSGATVKMKAYQASKEPFDVKSAPKQSTFEAKPEPIARPQLQQEQTSNMEPPIAETGRPHSPTYQPPREALKTDSRVEDNSYRDIEPTSFERFRWYVSEKRQELSGDKSKPSKEKSQLFNRASEKHDSRSPAFRASTPERRSLVERTRQSYETYRQYIDKRLPSDATKINLKLANRPYNKTRTSSYKTEATTSNTQQRDSLIVTLLILGLIVVIALSVIELVT